MYLKHPQIKSDVMITAGDKPVKIEMAGGVSKYPLSKIKSDNNLTGRQIDFLVNSAKELGFIIDGDASELKIEVASTIEEAVAKAAPKIVEPPKAEPEPAKAEPTPEPEPAKTDPDTDAEPTRTKRTRRRRKSKSTDSE